MKKLVTLIIFLALALVPAQIVFGMQSQSQQAVIVSTPQADGAIYHKVEDGDTLYGIAEAYGMTTSEINILNGNSPEANEIYIGTFLLIRKGVVATSTPEATATLAYTPQPTVVQASRTPIPTVTPMPTATATPPPSVAQKLFGNSQTFGLTLIGISTIGIALVVVFGFLRKPNR